MMQWLFIDIGGPIIDDGPWSAYVRTVVCRILAEEGLEATSAVFEEVEADLKKNRAGQFFRSLFRKLALSEDQRERLWHAYQRALESVDLETFRRFSPLQGGAKTSIEALAHEYRLATLSNNLLIANDLLKEYGLWQYFSVSGNSAEVGFSKPDVRLFQFVLDKAKCRPDQALMVGDRIDHDILPAKTLGLKTARVLVGWQRDVVPQTPSEEADYTVQSLWELAEMLLEGKSRDVFQEGE